MIKLKCPICKDVIFRKFTVVRGIGRCLTCKNKKNYQLKLLRKKICL